MRSRKTVRHAQRIRPNRKSLLEMRKSARHPGTVGGCLLITLAVIALAALAYRYMVVPQGTGSDLAQAAPPPAPAVTVAKPLVETLRGVERFHGPVRGPGTRSRSARASAVISNRSISPTARSCKKGDLLFVIEPRPFEIALDTAKAQLAQAEAQLRAGQGPARSHRRAPQERLRLRRDLR